MKTNAKRQFKRFEDFYQKGTLQSSYVEKLEAKYKEEPGVVQSWFDYCEVKYDTVLQNQLKNGEENI